MNQVHFRIRWDILRIRLEVIRIRKKIDTDLL